jgi:hypothetical protein
MFVRRDHNQAPAVRIDPQSNLAAPDGPDQDLL